MVIRTAVIGRHIRAGRISARHPVPKILIQVVGEHDIRARLIQNNPEHWAARQPAGEILIERIGMDVISEDLPQNNATRIMA